MTRDEACYNNIMTKRRVLIFTIILFVLVFSALCLRTGLLQEGSIDKRDLARWEYENGVIKDNDEFVLEGSTDTCWLLFHSYASTPSEMRVLGEQINETFGDYVHAVRLLGHGTLPSELNGLSLSRWIAQAEEVYGSYEAQCVNINVVGSSLGGALALYLGETKDIERLYLLNGYFSLATHALSPFSYEQYISWFGSALNYSKKRNLARINDPEGRGEHVAYWSMPYGPIARSLEMVKTIKGNAHKVTAPTLLLHSVNDTVASVSGAREVHDALSSPEGGKEIIEFHKSDHVLLRDYDSEAVIGAVIGFESERR
jgi:carboxylesterase